MGHEDIHSSGDRLSFELIAREVELLETVLLNPPPKLALRINHELIIVEPLLPLKFDPAQPSQEE